MSKVKICIIAEQIYKSGGIERVLSHRINYWIRQGHEVHLITSENKKEKYYFKYDSNLIHHDLESGFNKSISLIKPKNLLLAFRYFYKLKELLDLIKPHVTLVVNYGYEYYLTPLVLKGGYCINEHHSSLTQDTKGVMTKIKNYYSRLYSVHVFLSEEEADLFKYKNKIIIPNPISDYNHNSIELNKRQKVVLSVGRIAPIKGYERLIDIWSKIIETNPEWRLEIYGDGEVEYVNSLIQLIKDKKIHSSAFIYPSTNRVIEKMLSSQIYAMTSYSECFPMVLLEAMQSKMAIISFDCPTGPRSIIKHGETGILIKDNDLDGFSEKLSELINNPISAQYLANNSYAHVQKYNVKAVMKMWDSLIKYR